jgi:hypothetical protein
MKSQIIFMFTLLLFTSCKTEEPQNPPTVLTRAASDITTKNATLNGEVTEEGYSTVSERGFVFSDKNSNPSVSDTKVQSGNGKGIFSIVLDKLQSNTKYYYKTYATNKKGTSFGEVQSITTLDSKLPNIQTGIAKSITYSSAELNGTLNDDGGSDVLELGFCISKIPNPTINDLKFPVDLKKTGVFNLIVIKLETNTKYYCKTYSKNEKGLIYGNEVVFSTLDFKIPSLLTNNATNITQNGADVNCELLDDGGLEISELGLVYSEKPNPTYNDSKVIGDLKSKNFLIKVSQLTINSKIYCRSFAKNSKGIGYGNQIEFSVLYTKILNVKTGIIKYSNTNVRDITVTGEILDNGGFPIEDFGIVVGLSPSPTVSNNYMTIPFKGFLPNNNGSYFTLLSSNLIEKNDNKIPYTFYIRAFASNSKNRVYGNEIIYIQEPQIVEKFGGIVAYVFQKGDEGYIEGEEHGYIMSKKSIGRVKWGCRGKNLIGASSKSLNSGVSNTEDILNDCNEVNTAAKLCSDYSVSENGKIYDDWFLPSLMELTLHFYYRDRPSVRYLTDINCNNCVIPFWSSTEKDEVFSYTAESDYLYTYRSEPYDKQMKGYYGTSEKDNIRSVIAYRRF